jgi:hypothetical protein
MVKVVPSSIQHHLRILYVKTGIFAPKPIESSSDSINVQCAFNFCLTTPYVMVQNKHRLLVKHCSFVSPAFSFDFVMRENTQSLYRLTTDLYPRFQILLSLQRNEHNLDVHTGALENFRLWTEETTFDGAVEQQFRQACLNDALTMEVVAKRGSWSRPIGFCSQGHH